MNKNKKRNNDNELTIRNVRIREDFKSLKRQGKKNKEAFIVLSEKYYLSESTINSIVYLQQR